MLEAQKIVFWGSEFAKTVSREMYKYVSLLIHNLILPTDAPNSSIYPIEADLTVRQRILQLIPLKLILQQTKVF